MAKQKEMDYLKKKKEDNYIFNTFFSSNNGVQVDKREGGDTCQERGKRTREDGVTGVGRETGQKEMGRG